MINYNFILIKISEGYIFDIVVFFEIYIELFLNVFDYFFLSFLCNVEFNF